MLPSHGAGVGHGSGLAPDEPSLTRASFPAKSLPGANSLDAMPTRAALPSTILKPRIGLPVMLLVACAYALLALLGTAGLGRALGGHPVAEILHRPSHSRAVSVQEADEAVRGLLEPDQVAAPVAVPVVASSDPAKALLLPPPVPPRGYASLAHWLSLAIAGLTAPSESRVVPWPDTATRGAVLARWYRSVVLHL